MSDLSDLERRVAALETRLNDLDTGGLNGGLALTPPAAAGAIPVQSNVAADPATALIELRVTNKRYQPENHMAGIYQEAVWFDCSLTLHGQAKPTRAVKGALEFCDLFGDERFVIGYTINDTLQPGRPFHARGIGFDYNQFMNDHQWMLGTDTDDMVTRFRVHQVMYLDGTSERLV